MKKYTAPILNVRMFAAEAVMMTTSTSTPEEGYVAGMPEGIQRAQVKMENMQQITKFSF